MNNASELQFRSIVEQHSKKLYAHIRSIVLNHDDTNDVLQNTFMKAWEHLDRFRNDAEISTWLFRIATNEALQHLRKQRIRNLFLLRFKPASGTKVTEFVSGDGENIKQKLEMALKTLSVQQRMVFGMKYFNEMKYAEIAETTKLSEGTLKAVYHNAVKKIEKFLDEND